MSNQTFWTASKEKSSKRGTEVIFGAFGDDQINTDSAFAIVHGGLGDDTVSVGGSGIVFGGWGDDRIIAGSGPVRAFGGLGDDTIELGGGEDRVDGGLGFDTAVLAGSINEYVFSEVGRKTLTLTSASQTAHLASIEVIRFDDFTYYTDGRNNAVLAGDDMFATGENDPLAISLEVLLANDRDFDGDTLTIASVNAISAAGATVSFDGSAVVYDPGTLFDVLAEGQQASDSFSYVVTDSAGSTVSATVTITIEGRNDAPVLSVASAISVAENATLVPAAISAGDADGDVLGFSLSGDDAALFTIDAGTGALAFAVAPDFEVPQDADGDNVYDLTVTVSDGAGASDSRDIAVTVTDVVEIEARINELHYDNAGTDTGEFVEVRVGAGQDASVLGVVLYNGSNGSVYNTLALPGSPASTSGGYDYYLLELPSNGLQNGSPDGIALVNGDTVIEFLSYEGSFVANDGPAEGMTSTDIGVSEVADSPVGTALERAENGEGWSVTEADTRGLSNDYTPPFVGRINEFHYDNAGIDAGEFVELRVVEGTDVSAAAVELYNGSNGARYGAFSLSGLLASTSGGYDYYLLELPSNGLQNGSPDGIALVNGDAVVEFLSYEGSFTAADGTAAGLTSTDIGVAEGSSTAAGLSLQRDEAGDGWADPATETPGAANDGGSGTGGGIAAPYSFDFETEIAGADWQVVSRDADTANSWYDSSYGGDGFAAVNAYGDAAAADDWLISPLIDISALENPVARFASAKNYDDGGIADPEVTFLYSTDYSGSGDPAAATWTELPYTASAGSFAETASGEIDLSGIAAGSVHFAFRYQSSGTGSGDSSLWQIDDFAVGEAASTPVPTETTLISEVQGTGAASALEGQVVTIEAIVVGDFQNGAFGTDGDLDGFYLQEQDADADGTALSSEGIFVYEGSAPLLDVQVGDRVRVTGTVAEYFGETQLSAISSIEVTGSGITLPTAAEISFPVAGVTTNSDGALIADLEAYEGMLVTVPQEMTVTDLYTLGRFGDMGLNAQGLVETYTQANTPDASGFSAFIEEQVKNTLIIDDGSTEQNPSVIPFEIDGETGRIAGEFDAEDALGAGDTVVGLTGVLRYSRGSGGSGDEIYRLNPTETPEFEDTTPRETEAPDVGGSITVSSFNVLNFFTSLEDEGLTAGPDGAEVRGASNAEEMARQLDKLVSALTALDSDVIGLLELENEIGDQNGDGQFAIGYIVDALNIAMPDADYQYVDPGVPYVGGDAIMVGMIYDANAVRLASGTTVEILTDADLAALGVDPGNPVFEGSGTSRVPLAATFEEIASGETFTVAVNHFKSKGSVSPFGDNADTGDGTGNNDEARTQAAAALDAWLDSDPTGSGDSDVLIIGDLNSYAKEDPIALLESEGYQNLIAAFLEDDAFEYSYGFPVDLDASPQAQTFGALDYALASSSLAAQVTGAAEWHINSLEAAVLDYTTDFLPEDQVDDLYAPHAFGSSDHDPLTIGLSLGSDAGLLA
ncbi:MULTISPECIES: ExeM/NucH family extracellular endonuclease [unclassified Salipiger]|uniref:ExeM/NucH family extracellular endonuclease n=1 Tax=Salipiger sp. PrR002 TaxID=2706489 RepID=UPI0013BE5468|nr:ExeM/NucH family extracellular endonuclease [Salipiger sp. PrR002]NDW57889.1 ExeM/NucH family extracellular endonuclease [Salipiger sp. PrR004]